MKTAAVGIAVLAISAGAFARLARPRSSPGATPSDCGRDGRSPGEHLWYEGDATKKWGYYVWRRAANGSVTKVIPATQGFLDNYSFIRDRNGTMYWIDRARSEVKKRSGTGPATVVARARFRDVRWVSVTPDGTVYAIDTRDLIRVSPDGSIRKVVADLAASSWLGGRHVLFGIWFDRAGNVYVADYAHRKVLRVTAGGRSSVFAESSFPWGPTGGVFAPNGDLWLLEYSVTNQARVRRVTAPARTSGRKSDYR